MCDRSSFQVENKQDAREKEEIRFEKGVLKKGAPTRESCTARSGVSTNLPYENSRHRNFGKQKNL